MQINIFSNQNKNIIESYANQPDYEKISREWQALHQYLSHSPEVIVEGASPILQRLGAFNDIQTTKKVFRLAQFLFKKNSSWQLSSQESGLYYHKNSDKTTGVFKIGYKRAATELAMHQFSSHLRLPYTTPGLMCVVKNPVLDTQEDVVEDLWSGNVKVFEPIQEGDTYMAGIVEPYVAPQDGTETMEQFSEMVMTCLAIGLRDAKPDALRQGFQIVDYEDVMPARLDLPEQEIFAKCASTHLPLLDHDYTFQEMSLRQVDKLCGIASSWNLPKISSYLQNVSIQFRDKIAESGEDGDEIVDEGFCKAVIEGQESYEGLETFDKSLSAWMFNPQQIEACLLRLKRLQTTLSQAVLSQKKLRPIDLVFAVDTTYHLQWQQVQRAKACGKASFKTKLFWDDFSNRRVFLNLGVCSVAKLSSIAK